MDGLTEKQLGVLMEMLASCAAVCEPDLIAALEARGLVERLGERRARLTDRGATLARELIRSERGRGTVWDSARARALVA
jgi:Mn-dependent DtxR family transcriptional regulator